MFTSHRHSQATATSDTEAQRRLRRALRLEETQSDERRQTRKAWRRLQQRISEEQG